MADDVVVLVAVCISFFTAVPTARALDPHKSVLQYNCRTWTRQDGLPATGISAVTQTKDGFLWLGTQKGLVRYDGLEFQVLPMPQNELFQRQAISSLAADGNDSVWLGIVHGAFGVYRNGNGFGALTNQTWVTPDMNVWGVLAARDGSLWISSANGVARWTAQTGAVKSFDFYGTECLAMFEDSRGRIWFSMLGQGVFYFDGVRMVQVPISTSTNSVSMVFGIAEDREGQFWFATESGVRVLDRDLRPASAPVIAPKIFRLIADREGSIWCGSDGEGLYRWRKGELTNFRKANGLADDHVTALYEDGEGDLWVGTRGGLNLLSDVKFPIYSPAGNEQNAAFHSVCAAAGGGLWAGSSIGLFRFEGERFIFYAGNGGLSSFWLKQVFEATDGDLYLANGAQEIEIFRDGKVVARHKCPTWPTGIAEDKRGVVLGVGDHLFRVNRTALEPYEFTNGVPEFGWIRSINSTKDGTILVAGVNGVFLVKDGGVKKFNVDRGLPVNEALWVCEDPDGVLWAGLASGVARIEGERVDSWTQDDGLFDGYIRSIVPDDDGWLWFHSGSGIFRIRRNSFLSGGRKATQLTSDVFDGADCVKTLETADVEFSACRTADGRIWLPCPVGLLAVDPARSHMNKALPRAHIERVRINGRDSEHSGQLVVPPGRGELEVQYTAPTFIAPLKQLFRYKLEGYDDDWQMAGVRRSAFYTNLKPGNYRFEVQACDANGLKGGEAGMFEIELLPFYYQTTGFRVICLVAGMVVVAAIYTWRIRFLKRRHRQLQAIQAQLESEVHRRTAELGERTLRLEKEIEDRKRMEREVQQSNRKLMEASRLAGMAEVATGVLHNVGNVLNSLNVSAGLLTERIRKSSIVSVSRTARLLEEHRGNLPEFLSNGAKGQKLPGYLLRLSEKLNSEQTEALQELTSLHKNIEHIKEIVAMQQDYATVTGVTSCENVTELIEDALRINEEALERHSVSVIRHYEEPLPPVSVDRHKVMQILINLIRNAKYACDESERQEKKITIHVFCSTEIMSVSVIDTGIGIPQENLQRIFSHGFTTRKGGHGFGLHNSALAAKELGGSLQAKSDGVGRGATFTLELPLSESRSDLVSSNSQTPSR